VEKEERQRKSHVCDDGIVVIHGLPVQVLKLHRRRLLMMPWTSSFSGVAPFNKVVVVG
jgi:hypothetical protein